MAADAAGNDLTAVGVPLTGALFFAPYGTTLPTPAEMFAYGFAPDAGAWTPLGLFKPDGGFEWTMEPEGDALTFYQFGYTLPNGLAKCELKVVLAQTDDIVRGVAYGKTPDAYGYLTIDAGGHATQYSLYALESFRNGVIRRRLAGTATVQTVKETKSEPGNPNAYEVVFKIDRDARLNNEHLGDALIPLDATPAPFVGSVLPAGQSVGEDVVISGRYFTGMTGVTIDGVAVVSPLLVSDAAIAATIPAGAAGASAVVVTTADGSSNSYSYTVV